MREKKPVRANVVAGLILWFYIQIAEQKMGIYPVPLDEIPEGLLTIEEAAKQSGINRGTISGWIKKGWIVPQKFRVRERMCNHISLEDVWREIDTPRRGRGNWGEAYLEKRFG